MVKYKYVSDDLIAIVIVDSLIARFRMSLVLLAEGCSRERQRYNRL